MILISVLKVVSLKIVYVTLNTGLESKEKIMSTSPCLLMLQIPNMSRRHLTPFDEGPEKWYLESLVNEEMPPTHTTGISLDNKKIKSKRKRHRTKSGTDEGQEVKGQGQGSRGQRRVSERQLSISSDVSAKSDEEMVEVMEKLNVKDTSESSTKQIKV